MLQYEEGNTIALHDAIVVLAFLPQEQKHAVEAGWELPRVGNLIKIKVMGIRGVQGTIQCRPDRRYLREALSKAKYQTQLATQPRKYG